MRGRICNTEEVVAWGGAQDGKEWCGAWHAKNVCITHTVQKAQRRDWVWVLGAGSRGLGYLSATAS